jgi:RND family efflux transporter MFP subunit
VPPVFTSLALSAVRRSLRCSRFVAALLVAAPLALSGCGKAPQAVQDIRPVRAITLTAAPVNGEIELPGEIRPRIESRVGFQVPGRISTRRVEVGQQVAAGAVLATLDPADFKLSAAAAAEQLTAAQVDRDQQRADLRRFEDLHRQGFISGAELERRRAQLDAAEARLRQAQAQADVSGNQAAHTVLRAPARGVISGVDAEVGQVVSAGQSVVRLALDGAKEVAIAIPEARLEALRRIAEVGVTVWASEAQLRGRVREIAPMADAATRTYAARITLLDPPPGIALGMTATVRFAVPSAGPALAVPLSALLREGEATYVWKVDRQAMTVERAPVQVAGVAGNDVLLGGGVQAGETIVTAGVHLLQPGQKVRLLDAGAIAPPESRRP